MYCTLLQLLNRLQDSSCCFFQTCIFKQKGKSVDSGQLASNKPIDLDLHGFRNRIYPSLAWLKVIKRNGYDRKVNKI